MVLDFAKEAIDNTGSHSINFDELRAGKANIKVFGVGGCGGNTVTWLFNKGINGATVYGMNTDALHLSVTKADEKLLIGKELTRGLGAGGKSFMIFFGVLFLIIALVISLSRFLIK